MGKKLWMIVQYNSLISYSKLCVWRFIQDNMPEGLLVSVDCFLIYNVLTFIQSSLWLHTKFTVSTPKVDATCTYLTKNFLRKDRRGEIKMLSSLNIDDSKL